MPTTAIVRAFCSISAMTLGSFMVGWMGPKASACKFSVAAILQANPAVAVHIQPRSPRLIIFAVRPEAQNVPVQVFHLHLKRPFVIGGRVANLRAGGNKLLMQRLHISSINPHPTPWLSLDPRAQKQTGFAARDRCEKRFLAFREFPVDPESKLVNVVVNACGDIVHAKDRDHPAQLDGSFLWRRCS